ncbi:MAG: ABC transporter ATP-binding protein [Acidimicrobiia bacterium]|nr:MAG: ABC transporter ATP-binding protein [Acidimicrobiia bacterium]
MIRIEGLTKRYGKSTVVDGFDLQVGGGSTVALWGPNGAGKTTVLLCILGFLHYEGTVEVGGFDARSEGKRVRSLVGYVPQRPGFYDDLTVEDTLAFSSGLRRLQGAGVSEAVERVGLGPHRNKRVGALSGGMRQRLALAVALLPDPPVLLLDEPTSNLDAASRESTVRLLEDLRGPDRLLVITSHHLEEVAMLVDRVVVMDEGRTVDECAPHELSERLGLRSWLHLVLDPEAVEPASLILAALGYTARLNGRGLLVDLPPEAKGKAVAALEGAGIAVLDLEVWR